MVHNAFTVTDTRLAAAMLTLGVPPYAPEPIDRIVKDGRETVHWNFDPHGIACNGMMAATIEKHWDWKTLKQFEMTSPEDPLCYLRIFSHNHERMLDHIKRCRRLHIVEKPGGKIYLVSE